MKEAIMGIVLSIVGIVAFFGIACLMQLAFNAICGA